MKARLLEPFHVKGSHWSLALVATGALWWKRESLAIKPYHAKTWFWAATESEVCGYARVALERLSCEEKLL